MKSFFPVLYIFLVLFSSLKSFSCLHSRKSPMLILEGCSHETCPKLLKAALRKGYENLKSLTEISDYQFYCSRCRMLRKINLEQFQIIFHSSLKKFCKKSLKRSSTIDNKDYINQMVNIFHEIEEGKFLYQLYYSLFKDSCSLENIYAFGFRSNKHISSIKNAYEHQTQKSKEQMEGCIRPFLEPSDAYETPVATLISRAEPIGSF